MLYRWWNLGDDDRQIVWRLYGWYSGLMMCGSCVGAVTWAAWMMFLVNDFKSVQKTTPSQSLFLFSVSNSWRAVFAVTYAIEFLCLSVAKLIVLEILIVCQTSQLASVFRSTGLRLGALSLRCS